MLPGLYPLQQIIVHHFFGHMMDGKNLITRAQAVKALFVLEILNSIQVLLHQHC